MAFTEKLLARAQLSSGSQDTLYTVPASTTIIIKHITISNANAAARTVQIWLVPNGGSVNNNNALINGLSIPGNGVLTWDGYIPLETAGDTIQGEASAVTSLTVIIGGATMT